MKEQRKRSHSIESHLVKRNTNGKPRNCPLSECKNVQKRVKGAKRHSHVADCRKDFLHKTSAEIANRHELVSVENVNLKAMSNKCFGNGKATMNNGFSTFLFMLAYKQRDRGHYLVKIDKRFPVSLMCRCCGMKNPAVKDVRVRKWNCPFCVYGRDANAAINSDREGLRLLLSGELENGGREPSEHATEVAKACGVSGKAADSNRRGNNRDGETGSSHINDTDAA